jgi:aspartyl-tRNA(Asn)/glutamyl-tRNA(Gln) amidotransferase subunit A
MADATTVNQSVPVMNLKTETSINALKGTRIGVPKALLSDTVVHPDIIQSTRNTLDQLSQEGAEIIELDMQFFDEAVAMYYILAPAEAASNLSRFDGVRYGYRNQEADTMQTMMKATREHGLGHEVKRRIMLGNYVLSSGYYDAYYGKAQRMRGQLCQHYTDLFKSVDVIVSPTTPTTAFKIGANLDPLQMYLADIATIPANLAGVPAVSVPIGTDSQGLPIGIQVTGKWFDEAATLTVAHAIEGLQ